MSRFTEGQRGKLKDLLKEKSLWQVYRNSRKIPFSRWNIAIGVATGAAVLSFALKAELASPLADSLLAMASIAFPLAIGQLGFLLAGFSFFATVADKELLCRMADKPHESSGLSYLKYNFLVFMRVFVEYLVFAFFCLLAITFLAKGLGAREVASAWLNQWPWAKVIMAASALALICGTQAYLIMQLASFIYNIYHVVMTSIRWELQKQYDKENKKRAEAEGSDAPQAGSVEQEQ